jgi:hypothetical protein
MTSRRVLLAAALALPAPALAERREPTALLIPGAAGSAVDRWTRGIVPFLERAWPRQPLTVRNQPGRRGLDALAELVAAPAPFKTIGVLTTPLLLARAIETGEASPLERIAPLAALVEEPVVLVAAPGTVNDLEGLRASPPGTSFATPPPGTGAHLAGLQLAERAGLSLLAFPSAARGAAGGRERPRRGGDADPARRDRLPARQQAGRARRRQHAAVAAAAGTADAAGERPRTAGCDAARLRAASAGAGGMAGLAARRAGTARRRPRSGHPLRRVRPGRPFARRDGLDAPAEPSGRGVAPPLARGALASPTRVIALGYCDIARSFTSI